MAKRSPRDGTTALTFARELARGCVGVRVGRLQRVVSRRYEQALRPIGLTLAQAEILAGLTLDGEAVRPSDLAERLSVERSTMSRNLALLQERGLVAAAATSPTGRSLTVAITPAGMTALARARDAWTEAQEAMIAQLPDGAPEVLDAWLAALGPS